ncbi:UMTA [Fusarium albosuccineum]|uniref:UMTA n=1 Tax=Fusarium albosuccineum TaxID=1237068 RepID=A0A8H4PH69_9HYPO|nr:UMTA [Fusarium albosuccineum]
MMLDDKLFLAPIGDNPQHILDVGTGSGIWAIDMADLFPSAHVVGTDISPTQPSWVPPNVSFQIDDAQLDWTFEPESFDFIHIRALHGAINDWPKLYSQAYKFLKPGGWLQHMEPGIALRCDNPAIKIDDSQLTISSSVFKQWSKLFYDAGDRLGRTFDITNKKMEDWAREAGFTSVVPKTFEIPYGSWPRDKKLKDLGRYINFYMDMSLAGFATYPMSQILGWSLDEITVLVAQMRSAINDQRSLPNGDMYVMYGQKPNKPAEA